MTATVVAGAHPRVDAPATYGRLAVAILIFQGVLGATIGILLTTTEGWWALVGMSALALGTALLLRTLGTPRGVATAGAAMALLMALTLAFGAGTGIAGVIPTAETFARFSSLLAEARVSIDVQSTPAPPLTEFLFLFAAAGGGLAVLADLIAVVLRLPALLALLSIPVLIVPTILLPDGVAPVAIAGCAVAYLLVLLVDTITRRARRPEGRALVVPAVAVIAALVIAVTAPGFSQFGQPVAGSGGIAVGTGVNPLIDLGQDLRRPLAVRALTYTTTAPSAPYLRMSSLDSFAGTVWRHTPSGGTRLRQGTTIPAPTSTASNVATRTVSTAIRIDRMRSNWLPEPYPASEISGLRGPWVVQTSDHTVSAPTTATAGQSYVVRSTIPAPTADQLAVAGPVPAALRSDLTLPAAVPSIIRTTTDRVTRGTRTAYQKAVAIQDYFHNGSFVYSETTPEQAGFDGDSMSVIARFLEVKSGYCVHFATAMAVMARLAGIPSRVAIGYLPGTPDGARSDGRTEYAVTSDDLHAWPELYFAGIGWLPFEPTVSRGSAPAYTTTTPTANPSDQASVQPTAAAPTPVPSVSATNAAQAARPTGRTGPGGPTPTPLVALLVALVLALGMVPRVLREGVRTRRLRRVRDRTARSGTAWRELVDTAQDLGIRLDTTSTPRECTARLERQLRGDADARTALGTILAATERRAYGPDPTENDGDRVAKALTTVLAQLRVASPRADRVRGFLAPRSLPGTVREGLHSLLHPILGP